MRTLFLMLATLVIPLISTAQVTLEEFRQAVYDHSNAVKMARSDSEYYVSKYDQYKTNSLPSLTLSGELLQPLHSNLEGDEWSVALSPQITQTIYKGGEVRAEIQKGLAQMEVAMLDEDKAELDAEYNADYAYYYLQAMGRYYAVIEEYITIIYSLKEVVDLRFASGYISKSDVLMVDARLQEAQYQQIALKQDYTIATQRFNSLRGEPINQAVELMGVDADSVAVPLRIAFDEVLSRRPDFLASRLKLSVAESDVRLAQATYNPHLSVGIAGSWSPHSKAAGAADRLSGALFLKLSAPIFHFGERRRAVGAARTRIDYYDNSSAEIVDTIREEEASTWAKMVDSRAQLLAAERSLEIATQSLDISTFSYSEGLASILDVMQSQISWLQLYTNSISAQMNYLVAVSAYRRIVAHD